jgi:cytochrome c biogenesis protein ResB
MKRTILLIVMIGAGAVACLVMALAPRLSEVERFAREEATAAEEYHALMRQDKALHAKVSDWANRRQARCKARGQVLAFDSGGDPGCSTPQPAEKK